MFKSKYLGLAFLLYVSYSVTSYASEAPNKNYSVSADVGDNTAQIVNKVIDKSSVALGQISAKLEQTAPKAWALVVQGTRATAEATLAIGFISLAWLLISSGLFFYNMKQIEDEDDCFHVTITVIFGMSAFIAGCSTAWHLLDSSVWVAYLSPEGFLALSMVHQALGN